MTATNTKADITAALPPLSVAGRDQLVRDELARRAGSGAADGSAQPDTLVVFDLNNIRWLTGFTGSAGTLIVRPDEMVSSPTGDTACSREPRLRHRVPRRASSSARVQP